MLLDALAIAAFADELWAECENARVQDLVQADGLTLTLELYAGRRRYLTLSADPADEGLGLSAERARRGGTPPTPLALALAARATGARLTGIVQPAFERVMELTLLGPEPMRLIAELIGRLANLILVDAGGLIVALARPVPPGMSRARVLLPGRAYQPPPAPAKLAPPVVDAQQIADWLAAAPAVPAWRTLVAGTRGLSPLAAREASFRAAGDAEATGAALDPSRLAASLGELMGLFASRHWAPSVAGRADDVSAYAAYPLTHFPDWRPMPSLGAALEAYRCTQGPTDPYAAARAEVAGHLTAARSRVSRELGALDRQVRDEAEIAALREAGELILAYQHQLTPGQESLVAGFDPSMPRTVALDPRLSAAENAQRYFERYKRAHRAATSLPERRSGAAARLATIEQLALDLDLAQNRAEIDAVADLAAAEGFLPRGSGRRSGPGGGGGPLRWVSEDGLVVLIGRNSHQNETVTFQRAARGDLWLHARDAPGAHVLIKTAGQPVPEGTLMAAAAAAAWFSRARGEARVDVVVTDVRNVRRLRGGGRGMVTFDRAETVSVRPQQPGG